MENPGCSRFVILPTTCLPFLGYLESVFGETDHVLDLHLCLDVFFHCHNLRGGGFLLCFLQNMINSLTVFLLLQYAVVIWKKITKQQTASNKYQIHDLHVFA